MIKKWLSENITIYKIYDIREGGRLQYIEGLRALAILMVFNVHFLSRYSQESFFLISDSFFAHFITLLQSGHIGVDLFFVISGFLICGTLSKNKPSTNSFFKQRVLRLLPAHAAVLFLLWFYYPSNVSGISFESLLLNLTFIHVFYNGAPVHNFVTWSLGWEWVFYVLFFVVYYIAIKKKAVSLFVLTCCSILLYSILIFSTTELQKKLGITLPMPGRFTGFYVGVVLAILYDRQKKKPSRLEGKPTIVTIFLSLAFMVLLTLKWIWAFSYNSFFVGYFGAELASNLFFLSCALTFGVILFLLNLNTVSIFNRFLSTLPLRILGQTSYSFYLVHAVICMEAFSYPINSFGGIVLRYVLTLLTTFIVATILYILFEKPYFHRAVIINFFSRHISIFNTNTLETSTEEKRNAN